MLLQTSVLRQLSLFQGAGSLSVRSQTCGSGRRASPCFAKSGAQQETVLPMSRNRNEKSGTNCQKVKVKILSSKNTRIGKYATTLRKFRAQQETIAPMSRNRDEEVEQIVRK